MEVLLLLSTRKNCKIFSTFLSRLGTLLQVARLADRTGLVIEMTPNPRFGRTEGSRYHVTSCPSQTNFVFTLSIFYSNLNKINDLQSAIYHR